MKRKIFSKLLMGALLVASVSLYVSCKDYDDDIKDLQHQIDSLNGLVSQKETSIKTLISDLEKASQQADADLKKAMEEADAAIKKAYADADAILKGQLEKEFQDADAQLKKDYEAGDVATLAAAKTAIEEAKAALQKTIDDNFATLNEKNIAQDEAIAKAQADATAALNALPLKADKTDLEAAVKRITDLEAKCESLDKDLKQAIKDIETLQTTVKAQGEAIKAVTELANQNAGLISQNAKDIAANAANIKINADDIDKLEADLKALDTKLTTTKTELEGKIAEAVKKAADDLAAAKTDLNKNIADAKEEVLTKISTEISGVKSTIDILREDMINRTTSIDAKYDVITAMIAKALRSLVYMPYLYVDGIESIEYPYLVDYKLKMISPVPTMNRQRTTVPFAETYVKTIKELASDVKKKFPKLAPLNDWDYDNTAADFVAWFGPTWPVQYHMNPSRATTSWADIKGWNRRNAEIITRSTAGDNGAIQVAEKYADGTQLFKNEGGVLTVGLKVTDPKNLANSFTPQEWEGRPGTWTEEPKDSKKLQYDDMIALQAYSGKDTVITSDYAMIYPERVELEGLVWHKYHSKLYTNKVDFDEAGAACGQVVHVWDQPKEALACAGDNAVYPDIELYYNDAKGICLKDLLGVHYYRYAKTLAGKEGAAQLLKFTDPAFGYYGLSCEFQLVGYAVDGNVTIDSNYAEFTDADDNGVSKTGTIRARNVKEDGETIDTESATSVDREPLVRVLVKRGARVLLDGYILIHITKAAPADADPLIVDNYPEQAYEFNLCDDGTVFTTNWSQFSYYVLTQKLDNMTKEQFDASYGLQFAGVPDLYNVGQNPITGAPTPVTLADNSQRYDDVVLFDKTDKGFVQCKATDLPGYVRYFHNAQGTTNHRFEWILTADELEKLSHDVEAGKLPKKITKYFRYTGQAAAQYPYIYVQMTFNLTRATIAESGIKEKNTNYWFKYTGNDDGWDAVVWNPWYPRNWENTKNYSQNLSSTFTAVNTGKNVVNFLNTTGLAKIAPKANINASINDLTTGTQLAKFYFTPYEFQITSQKGVKYTITPRSGKGDEKWNAFVCKYVWFANDGTLNVFRWDATQHNLHWYAANNDKTYTEHKWGTPEENKALHEKCAIDYNDGVYTNNILYAVPTASYGTAAAYTPIATLNQNIDNGTMQLIWREPSNDITKEVLNAVGYYDDIHSNILEELNCMVGVIAQNGCDVAINVPEYVKDESNLNAGTFYVSWQRPINVYNEANPMVDAKNNADYVWLVDFMKIFDWRGPDKGKMWGDTQWLWAYYNIKGVKIDITPSKMKTNMHQASEDTFVPMSQVTTEAEFSIVKVDGTLTADPYTVPMNLLPYNSAEQNAALLAYMGIKPENQAKKIAFGGGLKYENNGDNVTDFDVLVPVTVIYDWGEFVASVKVHIHRTLGN